MIWILTNSGREVSLKSPDPESITIRDIAHALSQICRFTGHTQRYYSVAEHCVWVSLLVDREHALDALLHDASEAYLGDVSMPLKSLLPAYRELEVAMSLAICNRFDVMRPGPEVKRADLRMLATERDQLLAHDQDWLPDPEGSPSPWPVLEGIEPYPITLHCWSPHRAKVEFLSRFRTLAQSDQ